MDATSTFLRKSVVLGLSAVVLLGGVACSSDDTSASSSDKEEAAGAVQAAVQLDPDDEIKACLDNVVPAGTDVSTFTEEQAQSDLDTFYDCAFPVFWEEVEDSAYDPTDDFDKTMYDLITCGWAAGIEKVGGPVEALTQLSASIDAGTSQSDFIDAVVEATKSC